MPAGDKDVFTPKMKMKRIKEEFEQNIVLAKMMADDIDKVYRKYAKAALKASEEREEKIRNEKYHGCANIEELQNLYGYAEITLDEFDEGCAFLEAREERKKQLSIIELHRVNLKDIRDRWKGTIKESQDELDEINGVEKPVKLNAFERRDLELREERLATLRMSDSL